MSLVSISVRRRSQRGEKGMGKGEKGSFIIEGGRAWMSGRGGPPARRPIAVAVLWVAAVGMYN